MMTKQFWRSKNTKIALTLGSIQLVISCCITKVEYILEDGRSLWTDRVKNLVMEFNTNKLSSSTKDNLETVRGMDKAYWKSIIAHKSLLFISVNLSKVWNTDRENSLMKMVWNIRVNGKKEKKTVLENSFLVWMKNTKELLIKDWKMDMELNISKTGISIKVSTWQENSTEKVLTIGAMVLFMKDNSKTEWEMAKGFGDLTTIMEIYTKDNMKMTWSMATEYTLGPTDLLTKVIFTKTKSMERESWFTKMEKFRTCNGRTVMLSQRQVSKLKYYQIQILGTSVSLCQPTRTSMLLNKSKKKKWGTKTRSSITKCWRPWNQVQFPICQRECLKQPIDPLTINKEIKSQDLSPS